METVLLEEAVEPARVVPLSVEQYHRMRETGILEEDAPVELLNGLLVPRDRGGHDMPVSPHHALTVSRLMGLVPALEERGCHLRLENPLTIEPHHEPEPDGLIVRGRLEDYADRHPGPADVCCLIEVADSSLKRDRTTKQRIYAAAGIPQYILVNLADRRVEIYTEPDPREGRYESVRILGERGTIELAVPGAEPLEVPSAHWLP